MSARKVAVIASAGWLACLVEPSLVTPAVSMADAAEHRTVEFFPARHKPAPRPGRTPERRHAPSDVELHLDDDWLQRWWGQGYLETLRESRGGPDVCRQPGRITWSTRQLPCPDRLPLEGGRRWSTSPDG